MSFIYPRVISITRQPLQTGFGALPPSGPKPATEVVLYSGVPASIQQKSTGSKPDAHLPADAVNRTFWRIFVPLSAGVTVGSVLRGDIAIDEFGQRYQIIAPYINSLGTNFLVERLEA
jgi:hypothetical protein